jgi:transcriptional regulator with XRE-family HTH domain
LQLFKFHVTVARVKVRELGQFINDQRKTSRLTLQKLAETAGVSVPYLSQIERGLRKPSAEILQAIAKGLRISAQSLYVKAGILDEDDGSDLAGPIMADPHLSERQRQMLLEIYQSFRAETNRNRRRKSKDKTQLNGGVSNRPSAAETP